MCNAEWPPLVITNQISSFIALVVLKIDRDVPLLTPGVQNADKQTQCANGGMGIFAGKGGDETCFLHVMCGSVRGGTTIVSKLNKWFSPDLFS